MSNWNVNYLLLHIVRVLKASVNSTNNMYGANSFPMPQPDDAMAKATGRQSVK